MSVVDEALARQGGEEEEGGMIYPLIAVSSMQGKTTLLPLLPQILLLLLSPLPQHTSPLLS